MNTNRTWIALLLFTIAGVLSSCTATNMTPRIAVYRVGDTLQVDLDEQTATRWSTTRDSLIINCENCETGYTRLVEKFETDNRAAVYISPYERLRLTLFSQDVDTIIIVEPLLADSARPQEPRRIIRAKPRRRTSPPAVVKKETPQKKEEVKKEVTKKEEVKKEEAPKKRATTARVTASEGVAVYKDKSKREVLKILPKGQTLPYIAREGSMISVTVDGQEGFVESEAVRIED